MATKKKATQKKKTPVAATAKKKTQKKTAGKDKAVKAATSVTKTAATSTAKKRKAGVKTEKRKHIRLHYSRLISFVHYNANNHLETPGGMAAVKDLSQAGVLVETGVAFSPGDKLEMDIAFEQEHIIAAQGEVIHIRKTNKTVYKAGVKFSKIKKKDLTYLRGFIDGQQARGVSVSREQ